MATNRIAPALLLIADISGYTSFVRMHALATSHARQIIVRLLKALIHTSRPPLQVAEIEGDAVFFYALAPDHDLERVAMEAKMQILHLFQVFDREIEALQRLTACVCEACTSVHRLKLKQVVHCGEVSIERIGRFEKLFGIDVIVVHRMLKNTVPAKQYLMMTEPVFSACRDFYAQEPERRVEEFEGIGPTNTLVFYDAHLVPLTQMLSDPPPAPSTMEILAWKLKMHVSALPALFRLRGRREPSALLTGF